MDKSQEKTLGFHIQLADGVPHGLVGDSLRLEQVLGNLISNAIKFTEKGKIVVAIQASQQTDKQVRLDFKVQDSGIGMTSEQSKKLFQKFTQADSSTTREYGGTGLGLSICRRLVSLMGGDISIESEQGKGSTFSFHLEFGLASETTLSDPSATFALPMESLPIYQGESVLLAEDNKTNQMVAKELLEGVGLNVDIANNGQMALEMSVKRRYALILMDIQMPFMDGLQATEAIRQDRRCGKIPIIAMTAHVMASDQERCLAAGMVDYITKPIDPASLYRTLANCLLPSGAIPNTVFKQLGSQADSPFPYILHGIDTALGLKMVLQDQDLYRKMLVGFRKDHAEATQTIQQYITQGDQEKAKRLAHTLKGAAGNLGAMGLSDAAGQLEAVLKTGEAPDRLVQNFVEALNEVMGGLGDLGSDHGNKIDSPVEVKIDKETLEQLLQEMSVLLSKSSPQAIDLMPRIEQVFGARNRDQLDELKEKVDSFQFEDALDILEHLAREAVPKN